VYLARWARRLSWKETAGIFKTRWDSVFRAVKYVEEYSLPTRGWMGSNSLALMKSAIERKNIFPLFINWTRAVDGFYGAVRSEK